MLFVWSYLISTEECKTKMKPRHNKPSKVAFSNRRTALREPKETPTASDTKDVMLTLERPGARKISVAGSFNEWNPERTPMSRDLEGTWRATLSLKPGRYEYRFVADGQWISDHNASESVLNEYGSTNSVLIV